MTLYITMASLLQAVHTNMQGRHDTFY